MIHACDRYAEMVADITEVERKAEDQRGSILPSTRLQLSFGAHVLVTMFSFFALGYYGSKWYLEYDELWVCAAGNERIVLQLPSLQTLLQSRIKACVRACMWLRM